MHSYNFVTDAHITLAIKHISDSGAALQLHVRSSKTSESGDTIVRQLLPQQHLQGLPWGGSLCAY